MITGHYEQSRAVSSCAFKVLSYDVYVLLVNRYIKPDSFIPSLFSHPLNTPKYGIPDEALEYPKKSSRGDSASQATKMAAAGFMSVFRLT
jgi:hypothetical protein